MVHNLVIRPRDMLPKKKKKNFLVKKNIAWTLSVFSYQNDTSKVSADAGGIKDVAIIPDRVNSPFVARICYSRSCSGTMSKMSRCEDGRNYLELGSLQ
jgi:hypothetical protein